MKFCVLTLGCKVNSYESDHIKERFIESGYNQVNLSGDPDIIVVNTCSVKSTS